MSGTKSTRSAACFTEDAGEGRRTCRCVKHSGTDGPCDALAKRVRAYVSTVVAHGRTDERTRAVETVAGEASRASRCCGRAGWGCQRHNCSRACRCSKAVGSAWRGEYTTCVPLSCVFALPCPARVCVARRRDSGMGTEQASGWSHTSTTALPTQLRRLAPLRV